MLATLKTLGRKQHCASRMSAASHFSTGRAPLTGSTPSPLATRAQFTSIRERAEPRQLCEILSYTRLSFLMLLQEGSYTLYFMIDNPHKGYKPCEVQWNAVQTTVFDRISVIDPTQRIAAEARRNYSTARLLVNLLGLTERRNVHCECEK